jgi:hypothetical protein
MATLVKPPMPDLEQATHYYKAEAAVLGAELEKPLQEKVRPQAYVELSQYGAYQFRHAEPFRLEGLISYRSGYSQVTGQKSSKVGRGFTTLTTSAVEDLNILDVVTADRVVGRISTEHPAIGPDSTQGDQVPSITFLGTRFENLRIGGQKVEVIMDREILGPKPEGDKSYFDEKTVTDKIHAQYKTLSETKHRPDWMTERYPEGGNGWNKNEMHCSLVGKIEGGPLSFGHVIDLPHFGKVFLGELTVTRTPLAKDPHFDTYKFHLDMIRLELGCPVEGGVRVIAMETNGQGQGG